MDTPPPIPAEQAEVHFPDFFVVMVKMLRVFSILCALAFTGAGGVLAWSFFHFVKDIVQEPEQVVGKWQTAIAPAQQERFAPEAAPVPPTPAPPAAPTAPATSDTPTVPVVPEPIAEAPLTLAPDPAPAGETDHHVHRSESFSPAMSEDRNTELILNFANTVLDRFEAGHFSWLAGMCFLVIFCWILGKVPGVMISTGTSVLVALLKEDKPRH